MSPNYFKGRVGPFEYRFYSADRGEPPHAHIISGREEAKIWLENPPRSQYSNLKGNDLKKAMRVVRQNRENMLETWYDFFN